MLLFFVNKDDVIKRLKYSDGQTKNIRNFSVKTMITRGSINLFLPIKIWIYVRYQYYKRKRSNLVFVFT